MTQASIFPFSLPLPLGGDVGGWGRDPRKQKDFGTTVKKRPNKNIS